MVGRAEEVRRVLGHVRMKLLDLVARGKATSSDVRPLVDELACCDKLLEQLSQPPPGRQGRLF